MPEYNNQIMLIGFFRDAAHVPKDGDIVVVYNEKKTIVSFIFGVERLPHMEDLWSAKAIVNNPQQHGIGHELTDEDWRNAAAGITRRPKDDPGAPSSGL